MTEFIQWNCCGIRGHRDDLRDLVYNNNPSVICLQETFLHPSVDFRFPGYTITRRDREGDNASFGGVAILCRNDIPFSVLQLQTDIEAVP